MLVRQRAIPPGMSRTAKKEKEKIYDLKMIIAEKPSTKIVREFLRRKLIEIQATECFDDY